MEKIIVIDFAGTLIKAETIEKANELRTKILERGTPRKKEHANPEELYKINREFVEKLTGITSDMTIHYRKNDLEFMDLTGEQVQNQISSNLFQIGMYMAAKDDGINIIRQGMIEQLQRIKKAGFKLAILSGVRTDIISGVLQIAKVDVEFDYIYGQPPVLGHDYQDNAIQELQTKGKIEFTVGDKISDLDRMKGTGSKLIFIKGGHVFGGEEEIADYVIESADELAGIIK